MIAQGMPHIDLKRQLRLENFSCFVAILPWFNIDILHKLYLNIFEKLEREEENNTYKLRAITCADLLQSPEIERIGYNSFIINPSVQNKLRNKMMEKDNANDILKEIGNFMLSYIWECKKHFPSLKHLESYRVEGNIILNPIAEAERVTHNIVNRFNRLNNIIDQKNAVGYYLKVLNHNNLTVEQKRLVEFLNIYQQLDQDSNQNFSAQIEKLKDFLSQDHNPSETITIKLPTDIKKKILDGIKINTTKTPTLHALIIGIDHYPDNNNLNLNSAINDAKAISDYLNQNVAEGRVCGTKLLSNQEASWENIKDYFINHLFKIINPGDTFIFYFSGQGGFVNKSVFEGQNNIDDYNNHPILNQFFLNQKNAAASLLLNDLTILLLSDIFSQIERLPLDCTNIVILDTDFSVELNSQKINIEPNNNQNLNRSNQNAFNGIVIAAAQPGYSAFEDSKHGYFTKFILQALKNKNNNISYSRLINEINVSLESIRVQQKAALYANGNISENIVFLNGFLKINLYHYDYIIQKNKEKKEESLNLSKMNLNFFPEEIFDLVHLKFLDVSDNTISLIPKEIENLVYLQELNLSQNPLDLNHVNFKKLTNLKKLKLDHCKLENFPLSVLGLAYLQELDLSNNQIKFIPNQISKLPNLVKFNLTGNKILNFDINDVDKDVVAYLKEFPEVENSNNDIPIVMLVALDYENKLPNILPEIEEVSRICKQSGLEVILLINPTAAELNRSIVSYQNRLEILHFASYEMDILTDSDKTPQNMKPDDWVEFFKCIKTERFKAPLLFLNSCYGEEIINLLLKDTFRLGIGIKDKIDDWTAYTFATQFYTALVMDRKTIAEAMSYAQ